MSPRKISHETLVSALKDLVPATVPEEKREHIAKTKAKSFWKWWTVAALAVVTAILLLIYAIQTFGKDLSVALLIAVEAIPAAVALYAANQASNEATKSFVNLIRRGAKIAKESKS